MKLSAAAKAMNAVLIGADHDFIEVSTDSRGITSGQLFFALKGDHFNGEAFAPMAVERGACAVVVSTEIAGLSVPQLIVKNTTQALGKLAQHKRRQLSAKVVAITGSCGKTSVKGMLASILSREGKTSATPGNFNNHIGVPLTLLGAADNAEYLIVEAGTSGVGEIAYLAELIEPDIALVINVHSAHIEGFGSKAAIADEKSDIYGAKLSKATCVVNTSLMHYVAFTEKLLGRETVVFGESQADAFNQQQASVQAAERRLNKEGCACFELIMDKNSVSVEMSLLGEQHIENALAAASVAKALGIAPNIIKEGLEDYRGEKGRMQVQALKHGLLIDDTYNASPASVCAAIDFLSTRSHSILVLGDMGELGGSAYEEHRRIGQYAADKGISEFYCVGEYAEHYASGYGRLANLCTTQGEIISKLKNNIKHGSTVLVKGSRSTRMEKVCTGLTANEESH